MMPKYSAAIGAMEVWMCATFLFCLWPLEGDQTLETYAKRIRGRVVRRAGMCGRQSLWNAATSIISNSQDSPLE